MGFIEISQVAGYRFENELVCPDCATEEDLKELTEDKVLTNSHLETDDFYFCDRCKKQIEAS